MEYVGELIQLWGSGLHHFYTLDMWLILLAGAVIGLVFGALPGLTASMALSIFIPFTFGMDPYQGIAFLVAMYVATCLGGAISGILVNIPGAPSSVCTALDGYPMAQRGEAGRALGTATLSSALGGLVGLFFLMIFSPMIITIARKFGTWEYALLAVMGITMISYISARGSMIRGLIGGVIGLFLATIGQDPIIAYPRYTLGTMDLLGGINFVVILIGLFGMAEALLQLEKDVKIVPVQKISGILKSFGDLYSNVKVFFRSSIIGVFIGAIPAAGPTIATVVTYGLAKRTSGNPEDYGKGSSEGLVAAESADNACVGGALIPMMTLGIPGCPMTAVLIGALMIHGLSPGVRLFEDNPEYVSSIYIGYGLGLVLILVIGLLGSGLYAKLLSIPRYVLIPTIMVLCMVGGYSLSNSLFEVLLVIIFGVAGYFLQKIDIHPAPIILGVVLGPMFETNLRRSLMLADGSLLPYFTRPMCLILWGIIIFIVISSIIQARKAKATHQEQE